MTQFVSTEWLAARLGSQDIAIVDGSWHLPPTGRKGAAEYAANHIPGAVFFDIDVVSDHSSSLPHMVPTEAEFAKAASALGISNDKTIVVYDQLGLFSGPRVRWMFQTFGAKHVVLLEGGLPKWVAEGRPVTAESSKPAPAVFHAAFKPAAVASRQDIQTALAKGVQVIDARPADRFRGEAPEPRPGVRSGHIPGSRNLPFPAIVKDGILGDAATIKAALENAGVDPVKPMITSCGSGVSAAIISLALEKIGAPAQAVYDGSWAEWGADTSLPLGTGPAKI